MKFLVRNESGVSRRAPRLVALCFSVHSYLSRGKEVGPLANWNKSSKRKFKDLDKHSRMRKEIMEDEFREEEGS